LSPILPISAFLESNWFYKLRVFNSLHISTRTVAGDPASPGGIALPRHDVETPARVFPIAHHNNISGDPLRPLKLAAIQVTMNEAVTRCRIQLKNNGLPGVAFHTHVGPAFAPFSDNLSNNTIVNNQISGNGADTDDTVTPGTTDINVNSGFGASPIRGTVISGNVITDEDVDIAVNAPARVAVHLNNLLRKSVGVDNLSNGTIDATDNWWGCLAGPGGPGCSSVEGSGVDWNPWLDHPLVPVR
jgi:hypothetical protein